MPGPVPRLLLVKMLPGLVPGFFVWLFADLRGTHSLFLRGRGTQSSSRGAGNTIVIPAEAGTQGIAAALPDRKLWIPAALLCGTPLPLEASGRSRKALCGVGPLGWRPDRVNAIGQTCAGRSCGPHAKNSSAVSPAAKLQTQTASRARERTRCSMRACGALVAALGRKTGQRRRRPFMRAHTAQRLARLGKLRRVWGPHHYSSSRSSSPRRRGPRASGSSGFPPARE